MLLRTISIVAGVVVVGAGVAWALEQRKKCMNYAKKAQGLCDEIPAGDLRDRCIDEYGTPNCKLFGVL